MLVVLGEDGENSIDNAELLTVVNGVIVLEILINVVVLNTVVIIKLIVGIM